MNNQPIARNSRRIITSPPIIIAFVALVLAGFVETDSERNGHQNENLATREVRESSALQMNFMETINATKDYSTAGGELKALTLASAWLNSKPLTSMDLKGKVVLINFWTYTCIN